MILLSFSVATKSDHAFSVAVFIFHRTLPVSSQINYVLKEDATCHAIVGWNLEHVES
jgi:hypothetical protein